MNISDGHSEEGCAPERENPPNPESGPVTFPLRSPGREPIAPEPPVAILTVVLLYAAFASLWILLSDKAVEWLFTDPAKITLAATLKGWIFVAITSILLYGLMRRLIGSPGVGRATAHGIRPLLLPLALLSAAIIASTVGVIAQNAIRQKEIEGGRLQAIADLKTRQIADWMGERYGDARFAQTSRLWIEQFRRWRETGDTAVRDQLLTRMGQFRKFNAFQGMLLVDERGETIWDSEGEPLAVDPVLGDAIHQLQLQSATENRVMHVGPYVGAQDRLHLDFLAPLQSPDGGPSPVVILHVNPAEYLFPTLQAWPVPSASGETLLFRQDGDQVLYLNELRHRAHAAAKLRVPVSKVDFLEAKILFGRAFEGGLVEGVDYRGISAMGVVRTIPGTDWFLVAKIDKAELFHGIALNGLWIGLAGLLTLFIAATGVFLFRQRQDLAASVRERDLQAEKLRALQLLDGIAEGSSDAIFAKDVEGRYLLFNREAARVTGKMPKEVLGHDDNEIFPPEQAAMLMAHDRQVMEDDRPVTFQEDLTTTDGQVTFLSTKGPLHDAAGSVIGMFGISRDITERKQAEEEIERSKEYAVRQAQENAIMAEIGQIISSTLNIDEIYGAFCEQVKKIIPFERIVINMIDIEGDSAKNVFISGEDLPDRNVKDIYQLQGSGAAEMVRTGSTFLLQTEDSRAYVDRFPMLRSTFEAGFRSIMNVPLFSKGKIIGGLLFRSRDPYAYTDKEVKLAERIGSQIAGALANAQLYAERIQSEKKRTAMEGQLRQAQKMEALGTLAGGIAHDFNNILGIIIGYTELAESQLKSFEEAPVRARLHEVLKAASRAKDLVRQILAFSRMSEQEKKPIQAGLIVKEAMKMLRASLPSTIDIKTDIASKAVMSGDPTQIHQVLLNLCTNAAHAMGEEGGLLEVSLTDVILGPESITSNPDLKPGSYLKLTVKDTGSGIDPAIADRIFDPFFTTKEQGVGTGLGLSVVHGIVISHGGAIQVESPPGMGATFKVFLPAMEMAPAAETGAAAPLPRGRGRILVVDDEPALADVTRQMLENLGYEVDCRTSGLEALEIFRNPTREKPFDLVITDLTMPRLSGIGLARELRSLQPGLPILLCTGFREKINTEEMKSTGIQGFLMKPFSASELALMIRSVLDEGSDRNEMA